MNDDRIRVLVIDDDKFHAETVAESLERVGYECVVATSGTEGVEKIEDDVWDVVLTDLKMSDVDGLGIVAKVGEAIPEAEVLVITGHGDVKTAVEAIKRGAANYLTKPVDMTELRAILEKAAQRVKLTRDNLELRRQLEEKFGFEGVIGNSPKMLALIKRLQAVAPTKANVLILGETGTGKELVAKAIHNNSPRKNKTFVAMNCTVNNENLLDDELFGHEKGAYTGADQMRKGKFEYADGGTIFLDEIGDMPLNLQAKLLRVLENREVVRLGGNETRKVDVRIIAATNKDLEDMVREGTFRQDLYFRLKVFTAELPPLRERREDTQLLAKHFLAEFEEIHGKAVTSIAEPIRRAMNAHPWTGNVRELRNFIESAVVQDVDGIIGQDDVQDADLLQRAKSTDLPSGGADALVGRPLSEVERYYTEKALELTENNRESAAKLLGIGERTLYRQIREWELQDRIRAELTETDGDVAEVARRVEMKQDALEKKLKKWGLLDGEPDDEDV